MNKYRHLQEPQATLDFHDEGVLDSAAVKRRTEAFIADCRRRGLERVRLITGKGRHSKGRPVVGPQVRRTLKALEAKGVIVSFGDAKVTEGGAGAVDVVLAVRR